MSLLTIVVAIGIIAMVIGQSVMGASLRGRRVVMLPVVLTVIGIADLAGNGSHPTGTDIALITFSGVIAVGIGLSLGVMTRLESRDGHLWAQLPMKGLWLWAALIASRLVVTVIAHGAGAHVAAGTSAILLVLGLNRLAQAAVVVPRAIAAGIPFAPEKDGRVFGAGWFSGSGVGRG